MQSGEWWFEDVGYSSYADGDIGDQNHEGIAWNAALGLNPEENKADARAFQCCRLTPAEARLLRMRGVSIEAISYFSGPNPDPRYYAMRFMGWVRAVTGRYGANVVQCYVLDDEALKKIQNAEVWDEEDETSDETISVEELLGGWYEEVPLRVLLRASSAAQVKAYMAGHGRDAFDGLRKRG